jgi:replicative DNA helicase
MNIYDSQLELTAIRVVCAKSDNLKPLAVKLLSKLDESYFHDEVALECFNRIKHQASTSSYIPNYKELFTDPVLSEETRESLKVVKLNKEDYLHEDVEESVNSLFTQLFEYRRVRILFQIAQLAGTELKKSTTDTVKLVDTISDMLLNAKRSETETTLYHYGHQNNTTALLNDLLYGERSQIIKTGFSAFDDAPGGGGYFRGSLVVLGAPTSHGKSAMGNQLLINQASLGYNVAMVPLEMSAQEMNARLVSNLTRIDASKFLQQRLTDNEKEHTKKVMTAWVKKLKKLGSRYTIMDVLGEASIEDICTGLRPYNYDVILIDYIGLLSGTSGDESWKQLGNVARWAKVFAKQNDCLVILLAQIKEDGVLRYSQTIGDHANNVVHWNFDDEAKETGVVTIKQKKARNQRLFDYKLAVDFSVMRFTDVDGYHPEEQPPSQNREEPVYVDYMETL